MAKNWGPPKAPKVGPQPLPSPRPPTPWRVTLPELHLGPGPPSSECLQPPLPLNKPHTKPSEAPPPLQAPLTAPLHTLPHPPHPANAPLPEHSLQVPFSPKPWLGALPCAPTPPLHSQVTLLPARSLSAPSACPLASVLAESRRAVFIVTSPQHPVRSVSLSPGCQSTGIPRGTGDAVGEEPQQGRTPDLREKDAPRSHTACLSATKPTPASPRGQEKARRPGEECMVIEHKERKASQFRDSPKQPTKHPLTKWPLTGRGTCSLQLGVPLRTESGEQ